MIDKYQRQIMTALLDKYERSSFFREGVQPTRRIMLKLYDGGQTDFPQYDIEQAEKRTLINRAVVALSETQLVSYQWMKGEQGHIIAKVWLNYDELADAYALYNRQPKGDAIDDICLKLLDELDKVHNTDWAKRYISDLYDVISKKRDIGNRLPSNQTERNDLFRAIRFIDSMSESEVLERVFSLQCFGDSKRFEKSVKSRLLGVLRKYLDADDDATDEELFKQIGIVKYPEQFEFCGNVMLAFETGTVDFSCLRFGSAICSADLWQGDLRIAPVVNRVLTIENRANYIEYIYKHRKDNELILYHGGQYSPPKRQFLLAVAKAMPHNCEWYHWGDIDYGGFTMLSRLRREIKSDVTPYRMNKDELKHYDKLAAPISLSYAEKLNNLKQRRELNDCIECIDYMIANKVRLEQEAMLTNSISE